MTAGPGGDGAPAPRTAKSELRTRAIFAPLMLGIVAAVYWFDATWMAERGLRGTLTAALLGLLGMGGVAEYVAMMRNAGFAVARILLPVYSGLLLASPFFFGWLQMDRELYPLVISTLAL
ncbi:MAG: hypothetical protein O2865_16970, partial [Planctomycetota bacterium]|nr:hypothetical protein [Planctomycetota bacterium]